MTKPLSASEFRERAKRQKRPPAPDNRPEPAGEAAGGVPAARSKPAWVPFPLAALPAAAADFVREGSRSLCVDPSFVALPALSVLAALIGTTRSIQLRPEFVQPCCLWTAYFGDSGTNKSSSYDLVFGHLRDRQLAWRAEYLAELEEYEDTCDVVGKTMGDNKRPPEPILRQIWTTDTTVESLIELMASGNRGALVASAELSGFIDSMSRYKASSDRGRWLEFYDGLPSFVNRKHQKAAKVIRSTCASITGGIQPRIYYRSMNDEHLAAGLGGRFLKAWPPPVEKTWKVPPISPAVKGSWQRLCDSLLAFDHYRDPDGNELPHLVTIDEDADAVYGPWFEAWHKRTAAAKNPHLQSDWSKLFGQAGRLALVHHCCLVATGAQGVRPDRVGEESMSAALTLAAWFAAQSVRVHGEEDVDVGLVAWIRERGGVTSVRDLVTGKRFDSREPASKALDDLVKAGQGSWSKEGRKEIFSLSEI